MKILNKYLLVYVLCLLFFALSGQEKSIEQIIIGSPNAKSTTYELSGLVQDLTTQEPIIGANITVIGEESKGTSTDVSGIFSIVLPNGESDLKIEVLGYKAKLINVKIYEDGAIRVNMIQSSIELEQVTIKGKSSRDNIESVISGLEQINIAELKQMSRLMGELDVLRSIQSLSGVTSTGDGASGFNVRGGNADENLILQDDALILNPSHTLGFFSLFHPDLVGSVNLYKGDQPASLGGRLSSVLDVKLREGNNEEYKFNGGIGLASSRLTFEGPIKKQKGSFIVGGRISYMDWILNQIKNINVQRSKAFFYDLTVKADSRLTDKTKVGFTAFLSADEFNFADEVNFEYETRTVTGYVNHLFSDQWSLNFILNIGDYNSSLFDIQGNDVSKFTNKVSYIRPNIKSLYQLDDTKRITIGAEINIFDISPGDIAPEGTMSTVLPQSLPNERAAAISPNIQYEWDIDPTFSLSLGLRYTTYNRIGAGEFFTYAEGAPKQERTVTDILTFGDGESIAKYSSFEPRLSIRKNITDDASIKASFNKSYQYLNQISNTSSSTPIDIWQLSDYHIAPQVAYNYSLGWFQNFKDGAVQSSIQAFYRQQPDIIEYKDFADLLLNENIERELVNGEGQAYGVELNYKREMERSNLQVNYTYSRSLRRVVENDEQNAINNGDWYASNFDKPHSLNLRYSKKIARMSELSVNFTYSTGRPLTVPISNFTVDNIRNIPIYSNRNEFRIPDYHRLDVSYSIGPFGKNLDKWESTLIFSVFNLYGRDNAYSVFFRQQPSRSVQALRIATLGAAFPSVTYNFKF